MQGKNPYSTSGGALVRFAKIACTLTIFTIADGYRALTILLVKNAQKLHFFGKKSAKKLIRVYQSTAPLASSSAAWTRAVLSSTAGSQVIVTPFFSMPRNQVSWRLAN